MRKIQKIFFLQMVEMSVSVTIFLTESTITHCYNANIACVGRGILWVSQLCVCVLFVYYTCMCSRV